MSDDKDGHATAPKTADGDAPAGAAAASIRPEPAAEAAERPAPGSDPSPLEAPIPPGSEAEAQETGAEAQPSAADPAEDPAEGAAGDAPAAAGGGRRRGGRRGDKREEKRDDKRDDKRSDRREPERANLTPERIRTLFAVTDGAGETGFRIARWTRPVRPAVYGAQEESVEAIHEAIAEACAVAGATLADPDAEGAPNFLFYVCDSWSALSDAPGLKALEPDLDAVLGGLAAADANQHRFFGVSKSEGVVLAVTLVRLDARVSALSAQAASLGLAARGLALWSEEAFAGENPIALRRSGRAALKGWFARLLAALYREDGPAYSEDPAQAEALAELVAAAQPREAAPAVEETEGRERDGKRRRRRKRRRGDDADSASGEASETEGGAEASEEAEVVEAEAAEAETEESGAPAPEAADAQTDSGSEPQSDPAPSAEPLESAQVEFAQVEPAPEAASEAAPQDATRP